jgi:hypothetical protein
MEIQIKKMRELGIFKNKTQLQSDNGILMLHQDDMMSYNSWFLTNYHLIDKVVFRGKIDDVPNDILNIKEGLMKIGNPKNVIITFSNQDTY